MSKPRRKRCGTAGCKSFATHKAEKGWFHFLLCHEHALKAHLPPLSCTRVVLIEQESQ